MYLHTGLYYCFGDGSVSEEIQVDYCSEWLTCYLIKHNNKVCVQYIYMYMYMSLCSYQDMTIITRLFNY